MHVCTRDGDSGDDVVWVAVDDQIRDVRWKKSMTRRQNAYAFGAIAYPALSLLLPVPCQLRDDWYQAETYCPSVEHAVLLLRFLLLLLKQQQVDLLSWTRTDVEVCDAVRTGFLPCARTTTAADADDDDGEQLLLSC